jgi:hypothetical protein
VPKFVEVCVVHAGHGLPASNVPSAIRSVPGAHVGDGDGVGATLPLGDADGVGLGDGVPPAHPVTLTLSTLQPSCETELSAHILQRTLTCWPAAAAGRLTVVVWKPPAPAFDIPLQLGRVGRHGFWKPVLIDVWS